MVYSYPFQGLTEETKLAVWGKGKKIIQEGKSFDAKVWRFDICGTVMKYSEHGDTSGKYGWEVDHIIPTSKGGKDVLSNLQPLHWKNNREKGDTHPWSCP